MEGLELGSFQDELYHVPQECIDKPIHSIKGGNKRLGKYLAYMRRLHTDDFSFYTDPEKLPMDAFKRFSFDEICKIAYGHWMHHTVREFFEKNGSYGVVAKIKSSLWRWGGGHSWNEVVDAYRAIRSFRFLDDLDFEIRFDHATHHNECGYSKYSRTFLDGALGYLVYYKKKHVMTIGFSVAKGKRLLIQQVQLKEKMGNRFLFKLPPNRLQFVIERFRESFKGYTIYVIDGEALIDKTLGQYREALRKLEKRLAESWQDESELSSQFRQMDQKDKSYFEEHIAHLEGDRARLVSFYENMGIFARRRSLSFNGLRHYRVVKPRTRQTVPTSAPTTVLEDAASAA